MSKENINININTNINSSLLLSIDIGVKNFAYCILNETSQSIVAWECFTLTKEKNFISLLKSLIDGLKERHSLFEKCCKVIVERQPKCNVKMQKVATALLTYFLIHYPVVPIIEYSSKYKLNKTTLMNINLTKEQEDKLQQIKTNYCRRKKMSVFCCENYLENSSKQDQDEKWIKYFQQSKKKDDLADSYLQGRAYILHYSKIQDAYKV